MFPLRPHISKSTTKVIIVIIWIISAVLAIPMALAYIIERKDYMVREIIVFLNLWSVVWGSDNKAAHQ